MLVARIACDGAIWASWENILVFRSGISGTASITKSTSFTSSILVLGVSNPRIFPASSLEIRSFAISLSNNLSFEGVR